MKGFGVKCIGVFVGIYIVVVVDSYFVVGFVVVMEG